MTEDESMGGKGGAGRRVAPLLAGGAAFALAATPALAAGLTLDPSLTEVTGLAADTTNHVYWTADRTAGRATAVGRDGRVVGRLSYGATPVDAQAVSYRHGRLWIGDIGDAAGTRTTVVAYRITAPSYGHSNPYRSVVLAYPDGPHDAHAMVVGQDGRVYLVTRGDRPGIYRSSANPAPGGTRNVLERVADAPDGVTDATLSTDGTKLVLRTDSMLDVLDATSFRETASAALPAAGEALTTSLDGTGLLATGSGTPVPVDQLAEPTTVASAPASGASSATATPPVVSDAAGLSTAPRSNLGRILSLAAAGVITLAAAAIVVVKR